MKTEDTEGRVERFVREAREGDPETFDATVRELKTVATDYCPFCRGVVDGKHGDKCKANRDAAAALVLGGQPKVATPDTFYGREGCRHYGPDHGPRSCCQPNSADTFDGSEGAAHELEVESYERAVKRMEATLDLQAIRERVAAATPGPWIYAAGNAYDQVLLGYDAIDGTQTPVVHDVGDMAWNDVLFIGCARDDVPALLAEVERLREELLQANIRAGQFQTQAAELAQLYIDVAKSESGDDCAMVQIRNGKLSVIA